MPQSQEVEIFMTEEEALWAEEERADFEQGSSTEYVIPTARWTKMTS